MTHSETTVYATSETVTNGTSTRVTVGSIPEGASFRASSVAVKTVEDPAGDFAVALFNGNRRVAPVNQSYPMSTDETQLPVDSQYDVGDDITALLDNSANSSNITVSVVVIGDNQQ